MHAEINCLYHAGKLANGFRGMTMYSTLMPCNMCAGAKEMLARFIETNPQEWCGDIGLLDTGR